MIGPRWVGVDAGYGWLALCVVAIALVIPAGAFARPGGGQSFSGGSSSSSSSSSYSSSHSYSSSSSESSSTTYKPRELSWEERRKLEQEQEAASKGREAGRKAARRDKKAGLSFDLSRHLKSNALENHTDVVYHDNFRWAYRDEFQPTTLTGNCLEIYVYPEGPEGVYIFADQPRAVRERFADPERMPLCERSVATPEQEAAIREALLYEGPSFLERFLADYYAVFVYGFGFGLPIIAILFVLSRTKRQIARDLARTAAATSVPAPKPVSFDGLRAEDPNFSPILFEDFAVRLYAQAHREAVPGGQLDAMRAYLTPLAIGELKAFHQSDQAPVTVLVGRLTFRDFKIDNVYPFHAILVEVEANLTTGIPGNERSRYIKELVAFIRKRGVQTIAPNGIQFFQCPSCRATFQTSDGIRCGYCGNPVGKGHGHWALGSSELLEQSEIPPALTSNQPEQGNQLPTVVDPGMAAALQALCAEDPAVTKETFETRLQAIYHGLNAGWMAIDERQLRPYVSDGLFDYFRYWLAAYGRQGLKNQLEAMQLTGWEPAKVTRDAFYDAITARIYATGLDYTVNVKTGAVVSGSKTAPRPYTEYWTLIRGRGVRGAPRADRTCPQCGAPLAINMGGNCEYCRAHVTSGEFDWVLSKIEQDDVYRG